MSELASSVSPAAGTVDPREIEKFAAIAEQWWDPQGEFKPLHMLNPVRMAYIRDNLCLRLGRDPSKPRPLEGLRICDIGCGGGLICEPLARMGADVTGIDATGRSIDIAYAHAKRMGLSIRYRHATADALADEIAAGETASFDAAISMEVIEHVVNVDLFMGDVARLLSDEGVMVLSTFNRTPKSFALGIIGAEYILGWLPRGTHDWKKFVKPSELAAALRPQGFTLTDLCGMTYNPVADRFCLSPQDLDVNYLAFAIRN